MKRFKIFTALLLVICVILASFSVVTASTTIFGDVNADGTVTTKDSLLLKKYVASWEVTINKDAADVTADGTINSKDTLLLKRFLANWEVVLGPTTGISTTAETTTTPTTTEIMPTTLYNNFSINQIGYQTNAEKIGRVSYNFDINDYDTAEAKATAQALADETMNKVSIKTFYLINADTGKTVYQGITTKNRYDTMSFTYYVSCDFTSITAEGNYYLQTPLGISYTFKICDNPYKTVEDGMITALYYNRCGSALDKSIVGEYYAHSACHLGGAKIIGLGGVQTGTIDECSGGLHDAGDYGRYVLPANQVVADLLYSNELFPNATSYDVINDGTSGLSDCLDEARYEVEWLLKMQDPLTGGVYFRVATNKFVFWYDAPDNDRYYNSDGLFASRIMLKSTAGFVGSTAAAYRVFKNIDPTFANKCLSAAKKAYAYVLANMNDPKAHDAFSNASENNVIGAGEYGSGSAWSEIWWGACELFRATGETTYHDDIKSLVTRKKNSEISFNYSGISAYSLSGAGSIAYLLTDGADETLKQEILSSLKTDADNNKAVSYKDKYKVALGSGGYTWGSNASIAGKVKNMAIVDYFMGTSTYEQTIRDNMSYILGNNPISECYVTGFGSKSPQNFHHMLSISVKHEHDDAVGAPGWVVGGAYGDGSSWKDVWDNYAMNEVTIYWNTSPVFALASVVEKDLK